MLKQKRYTPTTMDLVFSLRLSNVAGASSTTQSKQRIEDKKEKVHPWENHTGELYFRVKSIMHNRVTLANVAIPTKRCSSVNIAIVSFVHRLREGVIATTAPIACIPGTSMPANQGTG
jgi:hypothetical protein